MRASCLVGVLVHVASASAAASCSSNPACAALLITGECCPTADGINLECCGAPQQAADTPPPTLIPVARASSPPPPAVSPSPQPPAASPSPPSPPSPPIAPGHSLLGGPPLGSADLGGFVRAGPHPQPPSKMWGTHAAAPLPTNSWWINLALADGEAVGTNVVSPLPYLTKALADGLHVCLPSKVASKASVTLPFDDTVTLGATELKAAPTATHTIASHDALSVTIAWDVGSLNRILTPLVRGMPYVSALYTKLTPQLTFATSPILMANGQPPAAAKTLKGTRFEFEVCGAPRHARLPCGLYTVNGMLTVNGILREGKRNHRRTRLDTLWSARHCECGMRDVNVACECGRHTDCEGMLT